MILEADRKPIRSIADVRAALQDGKALLYVERDSQRFFRPLARTK
jgi:hypothetical protein